MQDEEDKNYLSSLLKLRSLIATSSLCRIIKMTHHDQPCGQRRVDLCLHRSAAGVYSISVFHVRQTDPIVKLLRIVDKLACAITPTDFYNWSCHTLYGERFVSVSYKSCAFRFETSDARDPFLSYMDKTECLKEIMWPRTPDFSVED